MLFPDDGTYRILMQGLCRNSQVNGAVELLEDMLNKGFVPNSLSFTTLLNVILGFYKEGRALEACKAREDMPANGCLPNLVSYRALASGLSSQGLYDEVKNYMEEMMSKGFSPYISVFHALIKRFCNVGKIEEACGLLGEMLRHRDAPHVDSWVEIVPRICEVDKTVRLASVLEEVLKVELMPDTRIVEAAAGLEEYLIRKKFFVAELVDPCLTPCTLGELDLVTGLSNTLVSASVLDCMGDYEITAP
ncbi:hypothetical protein Acr_14g0006550 [Actinidia rufa]|uniref:Tetratricopeptide repeat (TPR)-like superfamily protein n=1 Tax=Actinidia rufa TaxID=165716 RepID=A0A7J0FS48_9ERIC|nr:hypothetical protein Acr_14g0006550 [Actinidia rufa]